MKHTPITLVRIHYQFIEGHHIFTSDDIDGLLVMSKDAETAYRDVAPSIKKLLKANQGIECDVEPTISFKELIAASTDGVSRQENPLVLSDKAFCLMPA